MGDILTFLWNVLNNWAGYSTGGLIVASVALWGTWRNKPVPRNILLGLAALFLLMAFYKAWNDEHQRVTEFQQQSGELRPYMSHVESFVRDVTDANTGKPLGMKLVMIHLTNIHPHAASGMRCHFLLLEHELKGEPLQNVPCGNVNDLPYNSPIWINSNPLDLPKDSQPQYLFLEITYNDSVNPQPKDYHQSWYYKLSGTSGGIMSTTLYNAEPNDKSRIDNYLRERGIHL